MSKEIRLSIPTMKCNGCVAAIEKAIQEAVSDEIGIDRMKVDLETKTASVEAKVVASVLIDALDSAGFDATVVAADGEDKSSE
ncbi:MAG: heavy-metal-associated domain-containing protein [Gammaproteobacteria bacterium]|nr:heavy-metal-associated domain-containing protein [Gammaproteobacteria bacterium]MDH3414744.1 heavy-metal-associated domain-containing protein [Gammaproteobacteria bacterium]